MVEVAATEFVKRFARYRLAAQREPVAVTHHGEVTEVLISRAEFDQYQAWKARQPKHHWAWELPDDIVAAIGSARMDPKFDALNAEMDDV